MEGTRESERWVVKRKRDAVEKERLRKDRDNEERKREMKQLISM